MDREVKQERTGWRDAELSERHRQWGYNCPMVDIDFLVAEYDSCTPTALIEYKHQNASAGKPDSANYKTLRNLANRASLPFFSVRYGQGLDWYRPWPMNTIATKYLDEPTRMTELEYVEFLYDLRGRDMPDDVADRIGQRDDDAT